MKKIRQIISCTLILFALPLASFAHIPDSQTNNQNTIAPMLKNVTPSVVNISVKQQRMARVDELIPTNGPDGRKVPVEGYAVGSGVIFDAAKGLIVTNAHVVAHEKVIVVTLKNGERYHAKLLAKDAGYDIAILHIDATHLTALKFANSDDVKVGDFVTAIGSPYGLSQTVTSGVVSAVNRTHPQIEGYQNFIQTDAPINPGNSGGALVDMQGELIGINTAMVAPTDGSIGLGFSIPSNMVQAVIEQLLKYGKVERGVLGVIVQNVTPELADAMHLQNEKGTIVSQVLPNTPAAAAGIQSGDLITEIDHHPVRSSVQLRNQMGLIRPKSEVTITYIRNNATKTANATVADPKTIEDKTIPYVGGMRVQDINELESDGTQLQGVIVAGLSDTSNGALAGLAVGDVITTVDSKPIANIKAFMQSLQNQTKPVLLKVVRGEDDVFLVLNKD